jgi:DNA-binding beta-propeller fold protein YncE
MNARLGSLCLALVIGLLMAGCGSNSSSVTIAVSPTAATVLLGTSFQFISSASGSNNAVQWSVNGVPNGNATVGTISSTGLYTAPGARPVAASAVAIPVVFAIANSSIPNSGSTGSVIELQSGFSVTNFAPGNTISISGNSQPGWNSSFIIQASGLLSNGKFGVQIATPPGPPANGVGGTAMATPNITISAQVQSTSAIANATVTLDSGIRVALSQPTCTIGTNETFTFTASVSGSSNQTVTWTVSGVGTIDSSTGLYTAPATAGTATVTATSVADPTESANATVTIATAADPTVTALSPTTGALGATRQDVYLSGSNFICTTAVLVNGTPLPAGSLFTLSSTTFLVVLPDTVLSALPPSGTTTETLTFTVEREGGAPQACSTATACQLVLSPVRPALVASKPDSIAAGTGTPVTLDGGYFGTATGTQTGGFTGSPMVNVRFNGATVTPTFLSDRQLQFSVPSTSVLGLYPITVTNTVSCPTLGASTCGMGSPNGFMAALNLAVQPTFSSPPSPGTSVPVGMTPTSIAINTATGVAVVTNEGVKSSTGLGHDISLIDLTQSPLTAKFICTEAVGATLTTTETTCPGAGALEPPGPVGVAVDNLRKLALVANSGNSTLAVVDLSGTHCVPPGTTPCVTSLLTFTAADINGNPLLLAPQAIGVNPVTGRALVAFSTSSGAGGSNAGAILDMNQVQAAQGSVALPAAGAAPILINVVNINNGPKPHIAVSSKLNWALATPGGTGSLSVVDLGRQTTNQITTLSCSAGVVTANVSTIPALQAGQPVLISGASPSSLDGIFQARSVSNTNFTYSQASCVSGSGGTAAYAVPVVTIATNPNVRGVSINDETQKALLVDPTNTVPAFVFNLLDQSSSAVSGLPSGSNNVATAMNPLTNTGLIVNQGAQVTLVDPVTPTVIQNSTFTIGIAPLVDGAIDPVTNQGLIVSQGSNSVILFSLGGTLRSGAPQIIQSSFVPAGSTLTTSQVRINSSLGSAAVAPNQAVTLVGAFTTASVPRINGDASAFQNVSVSPTGCGTTPNICRVMTATLLGSYLTGTTPPGTTPPRGPGIYELDAADTTAGASNAAPLQVIQAVNLVTGDCPNPLPQGVAIDAAHNAAVVTEPGCNHVSLVSLAPATIGQGVFGATDLAVGTNPQGVAVYPQAGLAVAANSGSNNVSIVDIVNNAVPTTFTVDPAPTGVAIDLGLGKATVTANGASLVDVFPVSTTAQTPTTIGVQQGPTAVAIDQKDHVAVVANSNSNTASVVNLSTNTVSLTGSISFPQGVAFDPITGAFLVTSAASNQVIALNPNTTGTLGIRVGIGPSSIAYNFESGTLVTANNLSGTVSVVDFIDQTVREVFSLPSSTQFAIDIHPQTNLAVVADTADNEVLLVPLPH